MNKYKFVPMLTKEHLMLLRLNAFYNNAKDAGKQLHSYIMNYNFDENDLSNYFKLLTPKQIAAYKRLENSRNENKHLDNQVKAITAYGTLGYGLFLLVSAIIDNNN